MNRVFLTVVAAASSVVLYASGWIKGEYVRPHEDDTAAFYRECRNDVLKRVFKTQPVSPRALKTRRAVSGSGI